MKEFDDYVKDRFEKACEKEWFDPDGNSPLATCNRGFFDEFKIALKERFLLIPSLIMIRELVASLIGLVVLVTIPLSLPLIAVCFAINRRKLARKELFKKFEQENR